MEQHTIQQILQYAEDFFGTQDDPNQLPATQEAFEQLVALDPRAITIELDENSDLIGWMVAMPTSKKQMDAFVAEAITERELFEAAIERQEHGAEAAAEAVYLCAVFVLPAFRKQGFGRGLVQKAVRSYTKENPQTAFYTWPWSCPGRKVVKKIADQEGIEVLERPSDQVI